MSQSNNNFELDLRPKKLRPSLSIGKFEDRTGVTKLPDLTLQIALLNEFFYKKKDAYYLRLSLATNRPEEVYKNLTKELRVLNKSRWKKEPVSGFRLCNVRRSSHSWRFCCNIACVGSRYAAETFARLKTTHFPCSRYLYISFQTPRKTLADRAYQEYYQEFYAKSKLLQSQATITMLERYYWRLKTDNTAYAIQVLFNIFGARLSAVYTDPMNGIEISQSPNIDADDYFSTDRHLLDCRIRFFQSFGNFFNLLQR